ncbi:MAG: mannose-1-phosphate guanylyltransferase/mannose-6-phosphate isomerase [Burkholderiaceae bacterium]|jgi:mannose-1-phosphate guanylyltransferase/mannose-6-phosphate isomerase
MNIQPVILCGGSGTRLWPLSREQSPKQLLALSGKTTMLQATAKRLAGPGLSDAHALLAPLVVANEQYRFVTAEQLRQVGIRPAAILLEPAGRNTAPALTAAALVAVAEGEDPVLAVMPADHMILDETAFRRAMSEAVREASGDRIVTFGIRPDAPETGYGYIETGAVLGPETAALQVTRFVEKPDLATAQTYVESGRYLWNSGIFVMRAEVWLAQIGRHRPDILKACKTAVAKAVRDADFLRLDRDDFLACPSDSIDYAVMERATDHNETTVVPLAAGWTDVGSWKALHAVGTPDAEGNVIEGDVIAIGNRDSLIRSEDRLVAAIGLDRVIVVETPDAVLVAHQDRIQEVKEVVARLKTLGRSESDAHRKIYRPWGYYDSIDAGGRFQVKRIVVNPGAQLSLQMHHHRAEHWIVVSGTARVTRGEEQFLLSENQSTYIPIGTLHRLENPGKVDLEMIEVQSGSYLGEDDIVRFEDSYGRA